jgi:hypothetical protein
MSTRRESKIGKEDDDQNMPGPKVYVSREIQLDITKLENEFKRPDIEIYYVDYSGYSYEGRIFLNNASFDCYITTT